MHVITINGQQDTTFAIIIVSHISCITTRIEITNPSLLKMPRGSNGHLCHIITAKDTRELE